MPAISSPASASASSACAPALLAENGEIAKRWPVWLAFALLFYGAILLLVYAHHNWIADFNSPPLSWRIGYGLAFALFSAAMAFTVPAIFAALCAIAAGACSMRCSLRPTASISVHYIFIIWLQYAVYDPALPAGVKAAIVFVGTLSRKLGADGAAAEDSVRGADDLKAIVIASQRVARMRAR